MRHLLFSTLLLVALVLSVNPPVTRADDATCLAYGPGTGCTTSSGAAGICNSANVCQQSNTQVTPSGTTGGSATRLLNPLQGGTSLESFLSDILAFVVRIGAIIVVLMVVYVGYKFVVAQGEPGKISEARQMLLWTIVGALILLGAQAIALAIKATVDALSVGH